MLAGACVLLAGMLAIGFWVTEQIERGVTRNSAILDGALHGQRHLAPRAGACGEQRASPAARAEVDEVLTSSPLGQRLVSYKIWKEGGRIAYASRDEIIGRTFEPTEKLRAAWTGEVAAEFEPVGAAENAAERATGVPLLEIYSPIREVRTGRIIAVAEFYEAVIALERDLLWAKLESWAVVTFVTLLMLGSLFGIVLRGSRTIAAQREVLEERVSALSELLRQNEALRERVQRASSRASELNERYLRRISAELHDQPAQHLALASLRLDFSTH